MRNKGRVVTLVVEIQTDKYPQWIIDAHMKSPQNDVKVLGISEGNLMKKLDKALDQLDSLSAELVKNV